MGSKKIYSVRGRQKLNTIDIVEYEKEYPKTNKIGKVRKGKCNTWGRSKSQIFTK